MRSTKWRTWLIVLSVLATGCASSDGPLANPELTSSTSAPSIEETTTSTSPTSTAAPPEESTTTSTRRDGDCAPAGDQVALDRVWSLDTEIELLVDTRVTLGSALPLRSARQITIRSGPEVDGLWQLTMIDPVGDRFADYANRLPIINPVDTDFVVTVDYTVAPDGTVALLSVEDATAINVSYADFVFDLFGATDGELGQDPRFETAWLDLVAAGGLEIMDPSSAAARTLALLSTVHAHHGETFILDQTTTRSGEWREIALAGPLTFGEITVEASLARNGCVEIESVAPETSDGVTGSRSVFVDPQTGVFLGSFSLGNIPSIDGDIGFSTSISTLGSNVSD